ncbi:hypothetical protein [Winogradskyella poriferorum]|uniref:hypothetical protein n=1 Tax=Winogradskyella poriferorum TaxID=307627 RepID=UPI003D659139
MKNYLTIIILLFTGYFMLGQEQVILRFDEDSNETVTQNNAGEDISRTLEQLETEFGKINEKVSFGLSLGYNFALENLKSAQISPFDGTLIIDDLQSSSFVLSTVISVPISYKEKKAKRNKDKDGKAIGQVRKISDWSVIGIVNLVTFNEAQSGNIFNQKMSGGLGLSYNMDEHVAFGLSYELISYRKPKDFLLEQNGQALMTNGSAITSIDTSDNTYFFDRYAGTISFKVIYKLTTK